MAASGASGAGKTVLTGHELIALTLSQQQYSDVFGVVGIPVVGTGNAIRAAGINFYSFRNEQACSYAVNAYSYITGRCGVMLCVAGPGVVHSLAGVANAHANGWPLLLLSGAPDRREAVKGSFQESDLHSAVRPFVKFAASCHTLSQFPFLLNAALRSAVSDRPGPVFIQIAADLLESTIEHKQITLFPPLKPFTRLATPIKAAKPASAAAAGSDGVLSAFPELKAATALLHSAVRPLLIVGKGAAFAGAEHELAAFTQLYAARFGTELPFLPTPMGKGVLPDSAPNCVSAARSLALRDADVVVLVGARLNWMLHYGLAPRFADGVKFIQIDITSADVGLNTPIQVPIIGDARRVLAAWNHYLSNDQTQTAPGARAKWLQTLQHHCSTNQAATDKLIRTYSAGQPMSYYNALAAVRDHIPADATLIVEGANTMDIARTVLPSERARSRMDAGTFATMGVGVGYAIAAHVATNPSDAKTSTAAPARRVIAVLGDSAFGFSGFELETAARYGLPIIVVIINNNGIYSGVDQLPDDRSATHIPVTALTPRARYEQIVTAFGGLGLYCTTPSEVAAGMKKALANTRTPTVINVMIAAASAPKPQTHSALNLARLVGGNKSEATAAAVAPAIKSKL